MQEECLYECWLSNSLTNVSNTAVRGRKYLQRFRHAGPEACMQLQFLSNQSNQKSKNSSKHQITLNQKCHSHLSFSLCFKHWTANFSIYFLGYRFLFHLFFVNAISILVSTTGRPRLSSLPHLSSLGCERWQWLCGFLEL